MAVLVSSFTVVHSLLTLLTSGFIFMPFVSIALFLSVSFVVGGCVYLFLIVSLLE